MQPKRAQISSCVLCESDTNNQKRQRSGIFHSSLVKNPDVGRLLPLLLPLPRGVGYRRPQTALKEFKPVVSSQHLSSPRSRVVSFTVQFTSL